VHCHLDNLLLYSSHFFFYTQQALNQNILEREAEEKARRAREAREKAEAEKMERAARKLALGKITDGNSTQEGVMDSLLEALQTGSAFSRDQRRKRPKGIPGGINEFN
jgi:diaphanous 2